ncbi:unnamed protein product, partial [Meganyctiphanes norvegica]
MGGKNSKKKHNNRLNVNDTNVENSVNDSVQEPLNTYSNIIGMNQDDSLNQAKPIGLTNHEMCPVPLPVQNAGPGMGPFQNPYSNVISETVHSPSSYSHSSERQEQNSESNGELYIALYDYEKRDNDEITIREGDTLHILNKDDANWWLACHKTTHEEGYVPENIIAVVDSLDSNPWFFGNIKRNEANRCLMLPANETGSFLVRDSMAPIKTGEPTPYSLSVRFGANIKTYRIGKRGNNWCVTICPGIVHNSVQDLINYFKLNQGLCCYLGKPCIQPEKPSTAGLSHSDKWELDKSTVKFIKNIGSGQFGEVYEGIASNVRVAMKPLKPGTMKPESFLAEAVLMKKLLHKNLIQLYAVCTLDDPIYIITEFMVNGDLLNYLRNGEGKHLNENILIDISAQISTGMGYLEENKFIYHDLAARNVLVGGNNIVKVADFGLTRLIEDD